MSIKSDVYDIYKQHMKSTKSKINRNSYSNAMKHVHQNLYKYYNNINDADAVNILLKRLSSIEFDLTHKNNIYVSVIWGSITGFYVSFITSLLDHDMVTSIILSLIGATILVMVGLISSYYFLSKRYELLMLKYEYDLIIDLLKSKYEFEYIYKPKTKI